MPPKPSTESRPTTAAGLPYRTIDGTGNNLTNPSWGSAGAQFLRSGPAHYSDDMSAPMGDDRPGAREISNAVCTQAGPLLNTHGATDFVWMWGQFLDHDLDLAGTADPAEPFPIPVPSGDPSFDPLNTGTVSIPLSRSAYDIATGTDPGNPREQMNFITAYIDASNVYGSDSTRAAWLRMNDGSGRLKTSAGDLLPYNTAGLPNAGGTGPELFVAGDVRANEQVSLTALHTLFVREHNRLADLIHSANPLLTNDEVYEQARAILGAQIQVITYNEFLPLFLGKDALPPYKGYDPDVNVDIQNLFATACYRVGHTMLSPSLRRLGPAGTTIGEGNLPLRDAFFAVTRLTEGGGIEPLFRGAAQQVMQDIDPSVVDDVRNFLFGPPGAGGFDLSSLNIQRGRDHGLPTYNEARMEFGLSPATAFSDICADPDRQTALSSPYGDVDKVDLWIGALSEDHVSGAMVGELLLAVLKDQFQRLRDGDRFWYQNVYSGDELTALENTRLSDIIRRNTVISIEVQDNVFVYSAVDKIPTVSEWGLLIFALLLAIVGSVVIRSRLGLARC